MALSVSDAASPKEPKSNPEDSLDENSKTNKIELIQEETKKEEAEDEEGLVLYPYEHLTTTSTDPVMDIDVSRREVIHLKSMSSALVRFNHNHWMNDLKRQR